MRGKRENTGKRFSKFSKTRKKYITLYLLVALIVVIAIVNYNVKVQGKTSSVKTTSLQSETVAKVSEEKKKTREVSTDGQYIYLSDMNYTSQSKTGWGNIQRDKNSDGKTIQLRKEGEIVFSYFFIA